MSKERLKSEILEKVKEFYLIENKKKFIPGETYINVSGKIFDENELINLVESSLEGWWTDGNWSEKFKDKLKKFLPAKYVIPVNSGSSANLIAMRTLTSSRLEDRRIKEGDEIITLAAGFPTTINPIISIGAIPVFADIELGTYDAKLKDIEEGINFKTKAIFIAHTLGNPFNLKKIKEICERHKLWLIEDNCDALGSKYDGKHTGTFGDISTCSFYPAHHITTGEGGAVFTNNSLLYRIAESIRDWGRDCYCATGKANTCGKRFDWRLGELPHGYDHKYIYSEIGFNFKMTDLQAAIGVAQMDKLEYFINKRKENFRKLYMGLSKFGDYFILPETTENSDPSWFGFLLTIKDRNIKRKDLIDFLEKRKIATRLLFAGNITKQPYFVSNNIKYRVVNNLDNTNIIMENTFWIGVYPGISDEMIKYIINSFEEYFNWR